MAVLLAVAICTAETGQAQQSPRFLAKEDILIYGLALKVEPAQQTVPKDIVTIVSTYLQAPQLPNNLPAFAPGAQVMGTLRGPAFPQPLDLSTSPNTPFNIPALAIAGTYTLDNIRLVSNGQVLLRGVPESVRINVIEQLLVTQVTATPLTAQQIRDQGIVFDASNFQAYNFSAAFAIQGNTVNINFTVVLPTLQGAQDVNPSQASIPATVPTPTLPSLTTLIPDTLKLLQTQFPNLSVVGFTLNVPSLQGGTLIVPPIPAVIVIPGNIGFLNQFFGVMLMVTNAAPLGSNLVVTDLKAEIVLPPGQDGVVGTPDDPLVLAQVATGNNKPIQPVVQPGADGKLGTADDINQIGPQQTGSAEFLVEGRREGSHVVEMQLTGTLVGLPVGPVAVTGRAAGSVLVRNPKFTMTFTHPKVVNAGEAYTLDITVTNTSQSPANFVTVSLHPQNISGATLVGDAARSIDSIPAGDSQMVSFNLVSKLTGSVTAATLDSDANIAGRFELKTAVGELGIPLSPDSLILPEEANALPADLRAAAIGLLGKAYSVATAPPAALPPDVKRFSRQIVIDGAVSLAEAGLRLGLHEPLADSVLQLLMDFDGSDYARLPALNPKPDDLAFAQNDRVGFDDLRRRSVRGDVFAQAVASVLTDTVNSSGVAAFHKHMAESVSYRPGHISVMVGNAGPLPFDLMLFNPSGQVIGGVDPSGKVRKQVPFSDFMTFANAGTTVAAMALITTPDTGDYIIRLDPVAGVPRAPVTLSIVFPKADGMLRQIVFDNVTAQSLPTLSFTSADPYRFTVRIIGSGASAVPLPASIDATIVEPPPAVLSIVQQPQADVIKCDASDKSGIPVGRVVAVLFSKEVTPDSAQDKAKPEDITNYTSDTNRIVGAALQPGNRIAYLALRDPVGLYVPTQVTVSGVSDVHGHVMPAQTMAVETTLDAGGVVSGRVLQADGTVVVNANVRLFYLLDCGPPATPQWVGITSKSADTNGQYSWGFVGNSLPDRIVGLDPGTDEFRDVRFNIQRSGQRLEVDIVLLGRGTLQGRTLAQDGTPLKDTVVRVTSLTDQSQYSATSDVDGKYLIGRIPVGNILVEAVNVSAKAKVFISQAIPAAGSTTIADLVLLNVDSTPTTVLKTGAISGATLASDGITPVKNVPVIAWYQSGSQTGIFCPGNPTPPECAVAVVNSDSTGAYVMTGVTAGTIRLQAFDQTSMQQGEARALLPPDGAIQANILLTGGLGTVKGSVLDPNGHPVAGARVGGGLSLTTTDANGQFVLNDVPVGRRDIVAVSDALGATGRVTIDLLQPGEQVGATIVLQSVAGVAGTLFEADSTTPVPGVTVYLFAKQPDGQISVVGSAVSDINGHYSIAKIPVGDYFASAFRSDFSDGNVRPIPLKFFNQVFKGDIVFRGGGGRITGVALDSDGQTPLKAAVGVSGDQVVIAGGQVGVGFQYVQNYKLTYTDLTTGHYGFGGLWVGKVTVTAAGQFSPDPVSLDATIPAANATVQLDIRLKPTSSLSGTVFQPDGITPVGANVAVKFHSDAVRVICSASSGDEQCQAIPQGIQEEDVATDSQGHFLVPVINAGAYTISVTDPVSGKTGISHGSVRPGEEGHITVRLLGMGTVTVNVKSSDGTTPIPNAKVTLQQADYPNKQMTVIADASGTTVFSGGDAQTEGLFAVTATDERNGFMGRATGKITKDGDQVTVNIYLSDAWGTVSGHVFRPDGLTPVPNSDVVVGNGAGPLAFTVSDGNGAYAVDHIPVGRVTIDIFEAATARVGSAAGTIDFPQQNVSIDVVENSLGLVKGTVLDGQTLAPLSGWEVTLSQTLPSGRAMPTLRTTSSLDGTYSFPGASQGQASLHASRDGVNGSASAQATLAREGQVVDVPLIATLVKPLSGSIIGSVYNADGAAGANALVDYCPGGDCSFPTTTTAASDGTFSFSNLALGRFVVRARSQITQDAGSSVGEISFDGQTVGVTVALMGLTKITGAVYNADGSIAGGARLELTGIPASGCPGTCVQFALPDGTFSFVDVPASSFTIVATGAVSDARGIVGDRLNPGETKVETIRLEPFGQLTGRVLFPGGNPAANIVADLALGQRHLFEQSGAGGIYTFPTTPLGAYTLTLQDPLGPGIAYLSGTISGTTTLPDVVLDITPPAVVSVSPAPSAIGVPLTATVQIVFSKPIDPGSVTTANVTLSDGISAINGALQTSNGDTAATFTPAGPLKDQTRFTLRVANVQDRVGKVMPAPYASSFTTVDITPPYAVSIDPAPGASGVAISSPVRIGYSEPIDPIMFRGPPIVLSGNAGPVAGRIDYLFGNTVIVFTPNVPLATSVTYRVDRRAATDLSGNIEAAPASYNFRTYNNTPPTIVGLNAPPAVIENTQATVAADVGATSDIALVDFYINGVSSFSARTPPFAMTFQAIPSYGKPGDTIQISALASDTSGNRSTSPVAAAIQVIADAPPAVTLALTTPTGQNSAHNNDRVVVTVHATDDVGVVQLGYKANTGNPQDAGINSTPPPAKDRAATFAFHVPASAVGGATIRVEASAQDTKGQVTQATPVDLLVIDSIPPVVSITGATTGAKVSPGQQTTVAVSAQDAGGVASITLTATGVTQFTQTRTVDPPQTSAITSFTFAIPPNAQSSDSVTLVATASDRSGNVGTSAAVVLPVADTTPPTIQLRTKSGLTQIIAGEVLTVTADANDDVAVAKIDLSGSGAFTVAQSQSFSPARASASADFSFVVPATLPEGATLVLQARATDLAGNISAPAALTLSVHTVQNVTLPSSAVVKAGETATVTAQIPGGALNPVQVDLSSDTPDVATVTPFVSFATGDTAKTFTISGQSGGTAQVTASIGGVPRSTMTASVIGGIISGVITDDQLQPVGGAEVTVSSGNTQSTTSNPDGSYSITGAIGPEVSVKATDPNTHLYGYSSGTMNATNGYATINVVMMTAASIEGTVFQSDGVTPAGSGVRVDIYQSNDPSLPRATTFTDSSGAYAFPFVQLGEYELDATGPNGQRARATIRLDASAKNATQPLTYLGDGSVIGRVLDGFGNVVNTATVAFHAYSEFGAAPTVQVTTGNYQFDHVLIGQFWIEARDPSTGQAGAATGSIKRAGDTITADVHLAAYATLKGTVYRSDGQTTVAGATVSAGGRTTTTDASGHYEFDIMPLGSVSVGVDDRGTRGKGVAATTLNFAGQVQTLDVVLFGQSSLAITVVDANGLAVPSANVYVSSSNGVVGDSMYARADSNGVAVIDHVLAGTLEVQANNGVVIGSLIGQQLAANVVMRLTVHLAPSQPTGSITGLVLDADGQTPVSGGRIDFSGVAAGSVAIAADGTYHIDLLPLGSRGYTLVVFDTAGRQRAFTKTPIPLASNVQPATANFTFVGLGHVTGQVKYAATGTTASGFTVTVQSHNPDFAGLYSAVTNAAGFYQIDSVQVGPFNVSSGNLNLQLWGEGAGTLVHDGDTVQVDILLENNAISLPTTRHDANNFAYDVQTDGTVAHGSSPFDGAFALDVLTGGTPNRFVGGEIPTVQQNGREIVTRQYGLAGLNVTRKLFVPITGYFARFLEILSNPTANSITVDVQGTSGLAGGLNVVATSSGDNMLSVSDPASADRWVVVDDNIDGDPAIVGGQPATGFIFDGLGGSTHASLASFTTGNSGQLQVGWTQIVIPAGSTVAVMHFTLQQTSRAAASASADRLSQLPQEALEGLTADEIAAIVNFAVPPDGHSLLQPLPPLTGAVTGRVFDADGTSALPNTQVTFKSANLFYGRSYKTVTDAASGTFDFTATLADGNSQPIPVDDFSLQAIHPTTRVSSPVVAGSFAPGSASAPIDIVFNNIAMVRGTVRRHTGVVVINGTVQSASNAPPLNVISGINADGSYRITGLPPATYALTATTPHPQGTALTGVTSITLSAGDVMTADITIQPTGTVAGTVTTASGTATPNVRIDLNASGFSRTTTTVAGGAFVLSDVPEGTFNIIATDVASGVQTSTTVTVTHDQTSQVALKLPPRLVSIAVAPVNPSIPAGTAQQFTATGTYEDGSTKDLTGTATWSSSAATIATVSASGLARGLKIGQTMIQAAVGPVSGSTQFTVTPAALVSIALIPANTSIPLTNSQQFTATGTYTDSSTQNLTTTASWSSSSLSVATISTTGFVTGVGVGQTIIQATVGTISGSTTLTVTPAPNGFSLTGSLNLARFEHTATLLNNGKVLIAGGASSFDPSNPLNLYSTAGAELYDPGVGTFTPTSNMNVVRNGHTATLLPNGMVLITGGFIQGIGAGNSAELYDPGTGKFTLTGSMNNPRYNHTATLLNNGLVLVTGGNGGGPGGRWSTAELYDPATGKFTPTGSLNVGRDSHTATLLNNGMVLIVGGHDSAVAGLTGQVGELYDPVTGTFTPTGVAIYQRVGHTATLLNNGKVLIAGGSGSQGGIASGTQASGELYDPATGKFTSTGSMHVARVQHTATLLTNGTVLVAGGGAATAEAYDPAAGTFAFTTNNMAASRSQQTSTLLKDGAVLIAGGHDLNNNFLSSAELFRPSNLTPPGLASITLAPAMPTLSVGTVLRFTAMGGFTDGTAQQLASAIWDSSDTSVAEVTSDPVAFGVAAGTATITARAGTVTGSTTVTVSPAALVSIGLTPVSPSVTLGNTQQFTATGTYSDGSTRDISLVATWSSSSLDIATVTMTGSVTSVGVGQTTIQATIGAVSGSTTLTVMASQQLPPSGLVAWWPGDGNANDVIGGNNGTLEGATFAVGEVDLAFKFNGVNGGSGVNLGQIPAFFFTSSSSFTIEAWVNTFGPTTMSSQNIIALNYQCSRTAQTLGINSNGQVDFFIRDVNSVGGDAISPSAISTNAFHHIAGVRDGVLKTLSLYVDGVLSASIADLTTGSLAANVADYIGKRYPCPDTSTFNGLIDEVSVYNRALAPAEIQAIFAAGGAGKPKAVPPPSISSFTAGDATITAGTSTTLTAVFSNGSGSINPGAVAVTSGTAITITPAATTTYTLTVTSAAGASTAQVTVTVVPPPSISSFTAGVAAITAGTSTTLTPVFSNGTGSINPGAVAVTSGTAVSITPVATTTYTLTVTNSAGTSTTAQVTVTVVPKPSISSFTADATTITAGTSTTLTPVFSNGTGSINPGAVAVTSGTAITITPAATTTYTLTVTNSVGTSTTAQVTVIVVPKPSISSFTAGAATITAGTSTTLTAAFSNGTGSINPGAVAVTSGTAITITPAATTTYTLTVTNAAGATASAQVTVTVKAPVPLINQPLVPGAVAPGGPGFTLTITGTGFVSGAVALWNGSARPTTFVSGSRLTVNIPASDIATPGTASVSVVNPAPGGGSSNVAFLPVAVAAGTVAFSQSAIFQSGGAGRQAVGDFNQDGKLDLAVTDPGGVQILLGNGDGTFQPPILYPVPGGTGYLIIGDFNGDGKPDVAAITGGAVTVLLGNGDGTFQTNINSPDDSSVPATWLAAGDFNNDGKLDLVVGYQGGSAVSVLLGNGDGTFHPFVNYATAAQPNAVVVGDFNGDGKLDIATANFGGFGGNTVSILLGNGDGTFQPHKEYLADGAPLALVAADFNGDGKLDLAVDCSCGHATTRCGYPGSVAILLGNGDGTFQPPVTYNVGNFPYAVTSGDLNGDGMLDLAVTNLDGRTISILLGNGDGTFQPQSEVPLTNAVGGPVGIVAADFNGDGLLDLVTDGGACCQGLDELRLLLQTNAEVVSLTVTPTNPSILLGTTQQFTAIGTYRDGSTQDLTSTATWTSSSASVAAIGAGGLASGGAPGSTTITVTVGLTTGSTTLTVVAPASIVVTPANPSIAMGLTQQFTATGTFADGTSENLTPFVGWSSSLPTVATIGATGLARPIGQGQTTIQAAFAGISSSTTLTVTPAALVSIGVTPASPSIRLGITRQFTATGTYTDGSSQDLTKAATWTSSDPAVATIDANGVATPVALGQTTITATYGGFTGSTTLIVTNFALTGSLNTPRSSHTATLLNNGTVLLAGGFTATAELYDTATGTFSYTGSMITGRSYHTATLLNNGRVFVAGGQDLNGNALATAELYDPSTGTFTAVGNLNSARWLHTATLLNNGTVLLAGGLDINGNALAAAELYDPSAGTFTPVSNLNAARSVHTATLLNNGTVLIAGGRDINSKALAAAELYDPSAGTFTAVGNLNTARSWHTAALLNNGMVLIAGGFDINGQALAAVELYDPSASAFTPVGGLNTARAVHTATLLNNGTVLIAGGQEINSSASGAVELYDPSSSTFTAVGNLNAVRYAHTATLLNNGIVLVAGGYNGALLSSAELYQPGSLTPDGLLSIAVTPATVSAALGTTQQFTATGTFQDGTTKRLASVTWSSSNTGVAQITSDATNHGVALGVAAGTATIAASLGTISGSASLTVIVLNFVPIGGPAPSPRCCMGMAFDEATNSTVLFGGFDISTPFLGDTWILGQGGWSQLTSGTSPSAREGPGMAYDGVTKTVVLFGGSTYANGGTDLNDTWIWNGTTWTQLFPPVSPPARRFDTQGMAYDAATGTIVLFGGITATQTVLGDTWTWNGTTQTWTQQLPAVSPSARRAPIAYDGATGTVVLFGGDGGPSSLGDTWVWNGTNWRQQFPATGSPAPRGLASMAWDPSLHQVVLYGGGGNNQPCPFNDTWAWNGTSWSQIIPATVPPVRYAAGMAYDPAAQGEVLFAGFSCGFTLGDTWVLSMAP